MSTLNADHVERERRRIDLHRRILAGDCLPTTGDLLEGAPFLSGDANVDRETFMQRVIAANLDVDGDLRDLLHLAKVVGGADTLQALFKSLPKLRTRPDDTGTRLRVYLAHLGDERARADLTSSLVATAWDMSRMHRIAVGVGYAFDPYPSPPDAHKNGMSVLTRMVKALPELERVIAAAQVTAKVAVADPATDEAWFLGELEKLRQVGAGTDSQVARSEPSTPAVAGVTVLAALTIEGTQARKELQKSYQRIAGRELPRRAMLPSDRGHVRATLRARFPHFAAEIDVALRQADPVRLLLVGDPGCGKTSFARALLDGLGVPSMLYSAAAAADSSFAGTSSQWSTARVSTPLQLIARHECCDPGIILDELDKAAVGRHNGSLVDTLLAFLEPQSARCVWDIGLEVEVDLSAVHWIATANKLEDVPAPLRDRLRVIRMPVPGPEHLEALLSVMLADRAAEAAEDVRLWPPFDGDELDVIRQCWPGGSLRKLGMIVDRLLEGRRQMWSV